MNNESIKLHTLDELIEKNIGEKGSPQRDEFESELQMSVMGSMIREVRLKRNLTQAELGKRVGVQRAQISRIENSLNSASINTLSRIFKALDAEVTFTVRLDGRQL